MKVGIIEASGILKIHERDEPKIEKKDDVLIKIKRVGICKPDIQIFHGTDPFASYPRVWGHEFSGEVEAVGGSVRGIKKGNHVVVDPVISCGHCYSCKRGAVNLCENLKISGIDIDGGCQEKIVVSAANVHVLPEHLAWNEAVLVEPFSVGVQACWRANVQKGDYVFVMGADVSGLASAYIAKLHGAKVIVSGVSEERLNFAKNLFADYTINTVQENVIDRITEITGNGANVTIDALGSKESFEDTINITAAGGRIVELSYSSIPSEIAPLNLAKKGITICGSYFQAKRFPVVIDLIKQDKLKLQGFTANEYPLSQMLEAFQYVDDNSADSCKTLITFD